MLLVLLNRQPPHMVTEAYEHKLLVECLLTVRLATLSVLITNWIFSCTKTVSMLSNTIIYHFIIIGRLLVHLGLYCNLGKPALYVSSAH